MRIFHLLQQAAPCCFMLLFMPFVVVATRQVPLLKALQTRQASMVELCSGGGYMGKCLSVSIRNNTKEALQVTVDPALIFVPNEPGFQHLVAVGEEAITLLPGETKSQVLQTFCGKARARSPRKDIRYRLWKQGAEPMVLASRYIKANGLFNTLGQHAIWMFTDHHCLSNIYDPNISAAVVKNFTSYLARITHQEIPEYYTWHKINTDSRRQTAVYDVSLSKVYVDLDWTKESRRNMHVMILDADRKLYKIIESGEVSNSHGAHSIRIAFDPVSDPLGVYYVQLNDDENNIWQEKRVVLQHYACN